MPDMAGRTPRHRTFQMLRSGVKWGDRDALIIINAQVTLPEGHDLDWLGSPTSTVWNPADGYVSLPTRNEFLHRSRACHAPRTTLTIEALSRQSCSLDIAFQPEH